MPHPLYAIPINVYMGDLNSFVSIYVASPIISIFFTKP